MRSSPSRRCTAGRAANPVATERTLRDAWYGQPILWLGAVVLGASLAGCIGMIVLGARHADEPLPTNGEKILKVPVNRDDREEVRRTP